MINTLLKEIQSYRNPEKAIILQRFFKTWKWEYGFWDKFYWIIVPIQRQISKRYCDQIYLNKIQKLLNNPYHEVRLIALLILIQKYNKSDEKTKKMIFDLYIKNTNRINNWDLVDLSAPQIVWEHLFDKDKKILYTLAWSNNLWQKRISIVATLNFIKKYYFEDTIKISKILLHDKHDLIQKAVWWMLREMWKRDQNILEKFLLLHFQIMPRTMLRYSIEKLDEEKKNFFMRK